MPRCIALFLLFVAAAADASDDGHGRSGPARELVVVHKNQVVAGNITQPPSDHFQTILGRALAQAMGRPVRFLGLPRNRMVSALEAGDGDILCGYLPEWLPGEMDWSRSFIPETDVVVSAPHAAAPKSIADLRGQRIGTVLGYRYPDFDRVLGKDFLRDDGPSESMSMKKMMTGRFDHVITTKIAVDNQIRHGALPHNVHVFVTRDFRTMCAVSRRGHVGVAELNAAIDKLERSGKLAGLQEKR
jgi:polar amino acid transport system substrate-binding protein